MVRLHGCNAQHCPGFAVQAMRARVHMRVQTSTWTYRAWSPAAAATSATVLPAGDAWRSRSIASNSSSLCPKAMANLAHIAAWPCV
jgi:hypothetical protein